MGQITMHHSCSACTGNIVYTDSIMKNCEQTYSGAIWDMLEVGTMFIGLGHSVCLSKLPVG